MEFEVTTRSAGELCEKLRQVTLRDGKTQPYLNSFVSIETFNPKKLSPCQRYALLPELRKIEQLRWDIQSEYGWDILRLNGYLEVTYPPTNPSEEAKIIDILPPVCEECIDDFGELKVIVNDGLHRVYLAYQMGAPINVTYVRGVNKFYPYYAFSLPRGFEEVEIINNIPLDYLKKFHVAKQHKLLYRNFNSVFNNIGDSRPYTPSEDKRILTYEQPIHRKGHDVKEEKEALQKEMEELELGNCGVVGSPYETSTKKSLEQAAFEREIQGVTNVDGDKKLELEKIRNDLSEAGREGHAQYFDTTSKVEAGSKADLGHLRPYSRIKRYPYAE